MRHDHVTENELDTRRGSRAREGRLCDDRRLAFLVDLFNRESHVVVEVIPAMYSWALLGRGRILEFFRFLICHHISHVFLGISKW